MASQKTNLFITFEGGEGCGKSTQQKLLATWLRDQGHTVLETREPGGTPTAEKLREILLTGSAEKLEPLSDTLIFTAARHEHVAKRIQPALNLGQWVLCDRFSDSTHVYQSIRGIPNDIIEKLNGWSTGPTAPDLTFVYDVPVDVGLGRKQGQIDLGLTETRYESMGTEYHEKVRQGFLNIAEENPTRCRVIDSTGSIEDVQAETVRVLEDFLKNG